jgi:hypothetical protein
MFSTTGHLPETTRWAGPIIRLTSFWWLCLIWSGFFYQNLNWGNKKVHGNLCHIFEDKKYF